MNLKTNTKITYYPKKGTTASAVIYGKIIRVIFDANFTRVGVMYSYYTTSEEIERKTKWFTDSESETIFDMLKSSLPDVNAGILPYLTKLFYESFKKDMATNYDGISSENEITIQQ